eukprot:6192000-Pleurochrysis_carterae.AAC.1
MEEKITITHYHCTRGYRGAACALARNASRVRERDKLDKRRSRAVLRRARARGSESGLRLAGTSA